MPPAICTPGEPETVNVAFAGSADVASLQNTAELTVSLLVSRRTSVQPLGGTSEFGL